MLKLRRKRKIKETEFKRLTPPGAAPGTLIKAPGASTTVIKTISYGRESLEEDSLENTEEIEERLKQNPVTWIDVRGLADIKLLRRLGSTCKLHQLSLEDVVSEDQRPKVEEFDKYLFLVIRMLEPEGSHFAIDQLSMFIFENYLVTFQSTESDCLEPVRNRLRKGKNRIRNAGADYLGYAIIDSVIDAYFPVLEEYGQKIESLEERILENPESSHIEEIHALKRDLLVLRRNIWPVRETLKNLIRDKNPYISDETQIYLRDCYDHAIRIIDMIESYRQTCKDLMDLYLSLVSNKMNEVMKVLTVISTIFIPPTFVAGVYGMNFNTEASQWNMPELNTTLGYPICLASMALISISVLIFLYTRGWLRSD